MSNGYRILNQERPYFLTLQIVGWIDLFTRRCYRDIVVDSLNYCVKNKGLVIYAYVIMSNHLHIIARSDHAKLSSTVRDFKSYTSKLFLERIQFGIESRSDWMLNLFKSFAVRHKRNSHFQVWTHENHAEEIFTPHFFECKLDYIHNNPVKAGWVLYPEEYLYSSARDYADIKGFVEVEVIMRQWKTY